MSFSKLPYVGRFFIFMYTVSFGSGIRRLGEILLLFLKMKSRKRKNKRERKRKERIKRKWGEGGVCSAFPKKYYGL